MSGYEQRARDYLDRFTEEPTWDVYSPDAQAALEALCESIAAEARATAIKEAAGIADRIARDNSKLAHDMADHDLLGGERRHRAIAVAVGEVADQVRAIAPRPGLRLVAREDLAKVIEAAYRWARHIAKGKRHAEAATTRAAIDRLRAGEG